MDDSMIATQLSDLATMSDDELYRTLGMQIRQAELAQQENPDLLIAAQAAGQFPESLGVERGLGESLRDFGGRWWAKLEPRLYGILCAGNSPEREQVLAALPQEQAAPTAPADASDHKASSERIAYVLAPLIVGLIPFQIPLIASAAAMIAAKVILSSGLEATCDAWKSAIDARTAAGDGAADEPAATDQPEA